MTNVEKIKKVMDEWEARRMLHALEKLLELYRERKEHSIKCPLCSVINCNRCPWSLFMGECCGDYRNKHFPKYYFIYHLNKNDIDMTWRKRRLRQLPKWIKYYEQALANWEEE